MHCSGTCRVMHLLPLAFLVTVLVTVSLGERTAEWRLQDKLSQHYDTIMPPFRLHSLASPLQVNFTLKLVQIFDVNEKRQVMLTSVWIQQAWIDDRLRWDKTKFDGIEEIALPSREVWTPDTVLGNNAKNSYMGLPVGLSSPVLVSSQGRVRWLTPIILESACKLHVRYFPFDEQFCRVEFVPWSHDEHEILLTAENDGVEDILSNYTESGEWELDNVYSFQSSSSSSRGRASTRRSMLTYVVNIRRKSFYYFLYLITPCMLTSFLTLMVFALPPSSGERMVVGVTLLLALSVFFMLAAAHIPETSEVVPLIGRYYSLTIIEVSVAIALTCCILQLHLRDPSLGVVPSWMRKYIMGYLAKLVRIQVPDKVQELSPGGMTKPKDNPEDERSRRRLPQTPTGIIMMSDRVKRKQALSEIQDEWQLCAAILNRFFLCLYMIAVFFSLVGIYIQVPGFIVKRPEDPHR